MWSFEEEEDGDEGVRDIPLSAFFSSSSSSSSSSFVSLALFALPPVPSFEFLPALIDGLSALGNRPPSALAESLSSLASFPPTALLSSLELPSLLTAVSALLLQPSLGDRCVDLLAGLFDAAAETREAADVFVATVDGLRRQWTDQGRQWTASGGIRWAQDEKSPEDDGAPPPTLPLTGSALHPRLLRVVRLISAMQLRLPGYWELCSLSQQQGMADAVMALYALGVPAAAAGTSSTTSPPPSSLAPLHFFALVEPQCRWLPLWLYPTSMRRRILTALSSPPSSSLLAALSCHVPLSAASSTPPALPSLASPTEGVTSDELTALLRLHFSSAASALRLSPSGRRLLWCETAQDTRDFVSVPRISASDLPPQAFLDRYVRINQPVIVTGALSHWFEGQPWSVSHLQSLLGSLPLQSVFRSRDGRFKFFAQSRAASSEVQGLQREGRMTFDEFVGKATRMDDGDRYYLYGEPLPGPLQPLLTLPAMVSAPHHRAQGV